MTGGVFIICNNLFNSLSFATLNSSLPEGADLSLQFAVASELNYYGASFSAKQNGIVKAMPFNRLMLLNSCINSSILREIAVNFPIGYAHLILLPLTKLALEVLFVHMLAESLFYERVACKFIHSVLKR